MQARLLARRQFDEYVTLGPDWYEQAVLEERPAMPLWLGERLVELALCDDELLEVWRRAGAVPAWVCEMVAEADSVGMPRAALSEGMNKKTKTALAQLMRAFLGGAYAYATVRVKGSELPPCFA